MLFSVRPKERREELYDFEKGYEEDWEDIPPQGRLE